MVYFTCRTNVILLICDIKHVYNGFTNLLFDLIVVNTKRKKIFVTNFSSVLAKLIIYSGNWKKLIYTHVIKRVKLTTRFFCLDFFNGIQSSVKPKNRTSIHLIIFWYCWFRLDIQLVSMLMFV